jgi:hypothetical protein
MITPAAGITGMGIRAIPKCIYCGYESESEVHEYTDQGRRLEECDDIVACSKRMVENAKKEVKAK